MSVVSEQFIVRYWGVRGSIASPGPATVRYGGNTTCIEVRCDDHILVIDTGTGARLLGKALMQEAQGAPISLSVVYSHWHLDHIQGFPFFDPVYESNAHLEIYCVPSQLMSPANVLANQMTDPAFPVGFDHLPAKVTFHHIRPGDTFKFGDAVVRTCPIEHPGGSIAIRVDHRGRSFVQCSDTEHTDAGPPADLVELCRGADFLSYDSMYEQGPEYEKHRGWGHSTWQAGVAVADAAQVATFVAFHHEPDHDDDYLDRMGEELGVARPGSLVAREGMVLDLLQKA